MEDDAVISPLNSLWDFLSPRGENLILRWARQEKINPGDRARLDQKLERLQQIDFNLAIGTKLLNGPLRKEIYKLKVHGQAMYRPMLCRGPVNKNSEYTLLIGAIERDGDLEPASCLEDAARNREAIVADNGRRCVHAQFNKRPEE